MTRCYSGIFAALLCVLAVSCTMTRTAPPQLPSNVRMNSDAGCGKWLILTIRMEDGEELPFFMDTGCEVTCLDKALAGKLGKPHDLGICDHFGDKIHFYAYNAPRLYLGKTLLKQSGPHASYVATVDFTNMFSGSGRSIKGVLGMDILKNYCIQLDFNAHQVRFLDAAHSDKQDWGTAFPLTKNGACFTVRSSLAGTKSPPSLIDTGYLEDGWLTRPTFERWTNQTKVMDFAGRSNALLARSKPSTNETTDASINAASNSGVAGRLFPNATLDGINYSNVYLFLEPSKKVNGIGLRLLARNLVTLDFPGQKMYLKQMSCTPLFDDSENTQAGFKFLIDLLHTKGLPGLPENFSGDMNYKFPDRAYPFSGTFVFEEKGQLFTFHYIATKSSNDTPWKLTRAWKSNLSGNIVKDFPVP